VKQTSDSGTITPFIRRLQEKSRAELKKNIIAIRLLGESRLKNAFYNNEG